MIGVGNNFTMTEAPEAGMKGKTLNDEIGLVIARQIGLRVAQVLMNLRWVS